MKINIVTYMIVAVLMLFMYKANAAYTEREVQLCRLISEAEGVTLIHINGKPCKEIIAEWEKDKKDFEDFKNRDRE
jgi:hypothetical protein